MLHHPQREGKSVIHSGDSDYAVGSVLYQQDTMGAVSYTHLDVYKRQYQQ